MADLRELVTALGHTGVSTYIQTGNVLFDAAAAGTGTAKLAAELEGAIEDRFGIWASVVVLTGELAGCSPPTRLRTNPIRNWCTWCS